LFGDLKVTKARVQLVGSATFSGRGDFWKRRENRIIDDPAWIQYFSAQPEFEVKILEQGPEPIDRPEPLEVSERDQRAGSGELPGRDVSKLPTPADLGQVKPNPITLKKKPRPYKQYSANQLRHETKSALVIIARVQYGLDLDQDQPKDFLVGEVLKAQKSALEKLEEG
jgi:hypothetical protein